MTGYEKMSEYYSTVNSDIFGLPLYGDTSAFDAWVDLIMGIIDEYAGATAGADEGAEGAESAGASLSAGMSESGNFTLGIAASGVNAQLFALKNAEKLEGNTLFGAESPIAEPAGEHIDLSSVAQLLQDVLKAYDYADPSKGYTLQGTVTLSVSLGAIPITDLPVQVELRIGFDEQGEAHLYAVLSVEKKSVLGISVIGADTKTEIALSGGELYMKRTLSGVTEVSETTLAYARRGYKFGDDLLKNYYNTVTERVERTFVTYRTARLDSLFTGGTDALLDLLFFAINFSEDIAGLIPSGGEGDGKVYDAGEMVNSYSFADNEYKLSLNIGAIAGNDDLGDLNVTIHRNDEGDLVRLHGDMKMIDVITLGFDFEHVSPGSASGGLALCGEVIRFAKENGVTVAESGIAETIVYTSEKVSRFSGERSVYTWNDTWNDGSYVLIGGSYVAKDWTFDAASGELIF